MSQPRPPATDLDDTRRRAVRRTAWIAGTIACAVFVAFLLKAVLP